jgi:hypothetical protein
MAFNASLFSDLKDLRLRKTSDSFASNAII